MNTLISNIIQHLPLTSNLKLLFLNKNMTDIIRNNLDGFQFKCYPFTTDLRLKLLTQFFKIKNIALVQNSEITVESMKYLNGMNSIDLRYATILAQPRMAERCISKIKNCRKLNIYGAEFITKKICRQLQHCHTIKLKYVNTIYDMKQMMKNCHKINMIESSISCDDSEHLQNCYSINLTQNDDSYPSVEYFKYANIVKVGRNRVDSCYHLRNCQEVDLNLTEINNQETKYLKNCEIINLKNTFVSYHCLKNLKCCQSLDIRGTTVEITKKNNALKYLIEMPYLSDLKIDKNNIDYSSKKLLLECGIDITH